MGLRRAVACACLVAGLAGARSALAQPAYRVKDINPGPGFGSGPSGFVSIGATTYFAAYHNATGRELWATDGTAGGTRIVRDIVPGPDDSYPQALFDFQGTLFFRAASGLWKTDGTAVGTVRVGPDVLYPGSFAVNGNWLYFAGYDEARGFELWRTDGSDAGTTLIKDIRPGSDSSAPAFLVALDGFVYFAADGPQGYELWRTDGTEAGTLMIWDVAPGPASSIPVGLHRVGSRIFFIADDGAHGRELWQFDTAASVASLVEDIVPGSGTSMPNNFQNMGGVLYFGAQDAVAGDELWRSDGTPAGTYRVRDIRPGSFGSNPFELTVSGGVLYFTADDGIHEPEVWRSDGTEAGTVLVADVSGPAVTFKGPRDLVHSGGLLYFTAHDGVHGRELWRTDGTAAGTTLLDLRPGPEGSDPSGPADVHGRLYFAAPPPESPAALNQGELWTSDGTIGGTAVLARIGPGASSSLGRTGELNGMLFFSAYDGVHGWELWRSDGTEAGTVLLRDLAPGSLSSFPGGFAELNGVLYFAADGPGQTLIWRTDGTAAGTTPVTGPSHPLHGVGHLRKVGGSLLFRGSDADHGDELWRSDGTEAGTVLVRDIYPGSEGSSPLEPTVVGAALFFVANDPNEGYELWRSDGTTAGTARVQIVQPGPASGFIRHLTAVGGLLYFDADDSFHGTEPWRSDGTAAGTYMVRDVRPGPPGSSPDDYADREGVAFFAADDGSTGRELWRSQGSEASTSRVADIRPGPAGSQPTSLTRVGASLLFTADDGVTGRELWRTDGTPAGTARVSDIYPGAASGLVPDQTIQEWGGWAFFAAAAPGLGQELWRSDGTGGGTQLVQEITAGPMSGGVTPLRPAGGRLFLSAVDAAGAELWAMRPEVTVLDTTVDEGTPATVQVSLVPALDVPLAVPFATADGTAQATLDYVPRSGTLTFAPGATTTTVDVTVLDDLADEPDEDFFLDFAGPTPAYLADARARVVVRDDDPTLVFSVDDVAVTEGDAGDVTAAFTVRLSPPPPVAATVEYATVPGTAVHGVAGHPDDFTPVAGTLTFGPGVATQVVDVAVHGDTLDEPDELFLLQLRNPTASVVGDGEGVARILDDDGGTLMLLHLERDTDHVDDVTLQPGAPPNVDRYLLRSEPWSSYEVTIDAVSGDMSSPGPFSMGPHMVSETPVYGLIMNSEPVGTRFARAVRLDLAGDPPLYHYIVVGSNGCSTDCGPDDTYRIRVRETTGHIPRFNNSGGQRTVLILQNSTSLTYGARVSFWAVSGERLFSFSVSMAPRASAAIDTALAVPGATGSITVSHNGPYGGLVGKAVSFDPTTGFAFDTPMTTRPR